MAISRLDAADLSAQISVNASATGPRDLVYLAAVPALCAARRFSISLVMPQYSVSSAQRNR